MKACKTPVCYVAKNTNLTHCHSPPTQLKLQEKGGTVTRPLQVLHTLQWAPSWWASAGQLALAPTQDYHSYTHTLLGVAKRRFSRVLATHL